MRDTTKGRVIVYLALTFGLSSIFYALIVAKGMGAYNGILVLGLMWCPAFGAIIASLLFKRPLREMGFFPGKPKFLLAAYLAPIAAGLIVYGLVWLSGLGGFSSEALSGMPNGTSGSAQALVATIARQMTFGFAMSVMSAFGEELGWRGFLVPEMSKIMGFGKTALWSGVIWALYHYPIILFSGYRSNAPLWYATLMFTITVLEISFLFAWLRLKSGSLWTGVILHASHNLIIQNVFDALTTDKGATAYFTGEFGVGLALAYGAMAFWCWKHRDYLLFSARR
ncbi:MAG: type II CAAX endopeptidase family protein [Spirochaetales bacterium]